MGVLKRNVWVYLSRKMEKENFKNGKELLGKLKGGWEKIPLAYLEKFVDSMPRHIEAVIKAKTGATKD